MHARTSPYQFQHTQLTLAIAHLWDCTEIFYLLLETRDAVMVKNKTSIAHTRHTHAHKHTRNSELYDKVTADQKMIRRVIYLGDICCPSSVSDDVSIKWRLWYGSAWPIHSMLYITSDVFQQFQMARPSKWKLCIQSHTTLGNMNHLFWWVAFGIILAGMYACFIVCVFVMYIWYYWHVCTL